MDFTENHEIHPPSHRKMREWMAVLSAAGLDYRLAGRGSNRVLHVPPEQADAAQREVLAYEDAEAQRAGQRYDGIPETDPRHDTWAAAWGALFLVWFYIWLGPYETGNPITEAGAANPVSIISGEWWRLVTALTLHSDIPHLAGNAISLLLFAHAICKALGGGLGWLLILAGGIAGNALTAVLAGPLRASIGASTASFGALGIISAWQSVRILRHSGQWRSVWSRTWIPVCAGLALLGLMGTGEGTDLTAHFFGFVSGLIITVPFAWHGARGVPEWMQRALELICITVVMLCWRAALMY